MAEIRSIAKLIRNTADDSERRWSLVQSLGLDARLRSEAEQRRDPIAAAILDVQDQLSALRAQLATNERPVTGQDRIEITGRYTPHGGGMHRDEITAALENEKGNVGRAARALGISKPRLYELIRALDIPLSETRQ